VVARDLLGCVLCADPSLPDRTSARIIEVEAYLGLSDPASHAFRGPTPRAAIMFGEPGHLYVYFSYGVHHCANVVTEADGVPGAVLLRAARVEEGEDVVRGRRGPLPVDRLLSGPGNLCRGLDIDLGDNGADLCSAAPRLFIERGVRPDRVVSGPRVGISRAPDLPLRFAIESHPALSTPRIRARTEWRTSAPG